jgi:hypothetical protein
MAARSWTLEGPQLDVRGLRLPNCGPRVAVQVALWSLSGVRGARFFVGSGGTSSAQGGYAGSPVPIAAWLNPHLTSGYAVEVSKFFNIQPFGMQHMLTGMVAAGLTMEEARAVKGPHH